MEYHQAVLVNETVDGLALKTGGIYIDVTFGGGGHSKAILKKLKGGKLFSFDQDQKVKEDALIKKFYSDQSTTQTTETNNENLDENVNDENKNS